jgi:tetratricopeptide (TPR) repeat protein
MIKLNLLWRLFYLFIIFFFAILFVRANPEEIEYLQNRLQQTSGREMVEILLQLSTKTRKVDPQKSLDFANRAVAQAEKIKFPQAKAKAYLSLADTYKYLNKSEQGLEFINLAMNIFEEIGDRRGILKAMVKLGSFNEKNVAVAIQYYFNALEMCKTIKDTYGERLFIYLHLGYIYTYLNNSDKRLEYQLKGLQLAKNAKNKTDAAIFYNQLGITYFGMKKYDSALGYYNKALSLCREINRTEWVRATKISIAAIYRDSGNHKKSVNILLGLLEESRKGTDKLLLSQNLNIIGKNYFLMKQYKKAERYYSEALEIVKSLNSKTMLRVLYENYSDLYYAMGKFREAIDFYKKDINLRDEISNREKQQQIAEIQEKYEAEKKEIEIGYLKKEKKNQLILFISLFLLISATMAFILKKYIYLFSFWKKQKHIGRYRIIGRVSSGGMGNVFKAHSIRDKTDIVAIKVLKEELFKSQDNIKRFKREGSIIDSLNHANIVKIYERGEYEGKLYIVMEYISGKTLEAKIVEEGAPDIQTCLSIMIRISEALALIHSQKIVHRDLKPANIMLSEVAGDKNVVKLLDFGLSKVLYHSRVTETGMLIGTLSYQAPEQVSSQEFSLASDIFSIGRVFYELLVGKSVYDSDSMATVVEKILNEDPIPPGDIRPEIPDSLNRLIVRMLSKEADDRPTAKRILQALQSLKKDLFI